MGGAAGPRKGGSRSRLPSVDQILGRFVFGLVFRPLASV
jgi:hypothetical protein